MKFYKFIIISILGILPFVSGCGEKFDISQLLQNSGSANITGDTVYIPINPEWDGFNKPQAILVGREPFLYIADTGNDRIVMMNLNGDILGTREIKKPVAIAQDYKLNLIVCAQFDTVVNGQTKTFGAVYKLDMVSASHQIANAPSTMLLPRPADLNYPDRQYTGVAVFYNNTFIVSRTGPSNTSFIDPDNSILSFSPKELINGGNGDTLIGRVPDIEPLSTGLVSANQISSLTSFNKKNIDFIVTLIGNNNLKTQWLTYVVTPVSADYESKLTVADGGAFMTPNKFGQPHGTCIDDAGNIYVADSQKDSVYKFTSYGDELQSFGGAKYFNGPYAVAYYNKILYIADTGNNRILRFMLSTDTQ